MPSTSYLLALPLELQEEIIGHLPFPAVVILKMTCAYFNGIIKPLTHQQLLDAEETDICKQTDSYACRYCLRLRPASKFADNMLKRRKSRYGGDVHRRFCIGCGIQSVPGSTRYSRGSQIFIGGVCHVICFRCGIFKKGATEDKTQSKCLLCLADFERDNLNRLRRKQALQKAERTENREEPSFPDYDDSDEMPDSPDYDWQAEDWDQAFYV
ncbi:hypothetical protein BT63DRAFT_460219 [Microthyrium microscopicum]|uniref:F-box domain-containing protein n=1 Tax=Microthyrium microscopicum TaxID=703497 RepID=A0A6A6TZ84_9PEZI|nr:hypothetical protein BT63DRAFT_460219 [Microthyrium microscopicum]